MTAHTDTEQKILINCRDGANSVEQATVAFTMAVGACQNAETAVFITSDAAELCVKGGTNGLAVDGYTPLGELVSNFIKLGGMIWLCPICAKARNIHADDLIDGVEIAGVPRTMAFMQSGARLLA